MREHKACDARPPDLFSGCRGRSRPCSQLFQLRKIHAQQFLANLSLELDLDELGTLLQLTSEDNSFTKRIVANPISRVELLLPWFGWRRIRSGRRCKATTVLWR